MGNSVSNQSVAISSQVAITEDKKEKQPGDKPKACKACCACPETKRVRDEWYVYDY